MRSLLLAVLAAAPLAAVPPASAAGPCVAQADVPQAVDAMVLGSGSFTCALPSAGMTVTVCVESASPFGRFGWRVEGCSTATAPGSVTTVSESMGACVLAPTPVLVRTTAAGSNAAGHSASAASAPSWAPGAGSCGP